MTNPIRLAEDPAAESYIQGAVPWVWQAGRPYIDWLIGDPETARQQTERLMARRASEVYIGRAAILLEGVAQVGGYVALEGTELDRCRQSDALAMAAEAPDRGALLGRLAAAGEIFAEVGADHLYLSRLGVRAGYTGRGHGRRLLDDFLEHGSKLGFDRFRLDVSADNQVAIWLYQSAGFEIVARGSSPDGDLEYVAMTLEGTSGRPAR